MFLTIFQSFWKIHYLINYAFSIGNYICLNRGHLANRTFKRKIKQFQAINSRRNLNRLLSYNDEKIYCPKHNYDLKELCQNVCIYNCGPGDTLAPKPCFIEEISATIDL